MDWQGWARAVVVGRPHGVRAELRRRTGWFTWLDQAPVRSESPAPPDPAGTSDAEWVDVLTVDELEPAVPIEVFVAGDPVVVVQLDDGLYALGGACVHAGGPLAEGGLSDGILTCPWHGWTYDVRTGVTPMRANERLRTYEVRQTATTVQVRL